METYSIDAINRVRSTMDTRHARTSNTANEITTACETPSLLLVLMPPVPDELVGDESEAVGRALEPVFGSEDGFNVGSVFGSVDGTMVGSVLGCVEFSVVGCVVGSVVVSEVGLVDGGVVGLVVELVCGGSVVGLAVGCVVGLVVGAVVGL